jgi:NAD(P)-dependent dehydrogenase (short-subunit alcohol dehydrogenase family)
MEIEKKYVLVLGGSTFMGKEVLKRFSEIQGTEVHYINRGKTYW